MRPSETSMMADQEAWPRWPFLPVKEIEYENIPVCGFIEANHPTRVYIGNVYRLRRWEELEHKDYDSIEDLAKIWKVD